MTDFGLNVLVPVIDAFSRCLDWYIVMFGFTITVKEIFIFTASISLVIVFLNSFRS